MINNHEFWWRYFPKKELMQFYISLAVRTLAISLLGIFVPLYLYAEMGYSMEQTLLLFMAYSVVFAISTPAAAKFSARYGAKHSVLLSVPFYLAFVGLLYSLPYYKIPLMVIGSLLGLSQAFYWIGMHLVFNHASNHKHRGEECGKRASASVAAGTLGPFLGGLLIVTLGFKVVFLTAAALLFFSALILFRSKEEHVPYHFSVRSVVDRRFWRNSLFYVSRGTRVMADGVIWPLFIFVILDSYLSLGIVSSILSGLSAVLLYFTGKYSDGWDKRKFVRLVSIFESLACIFRGFVSTVGQIYGATIFAALATGIREAPLEAMEYDKARDLGAAYFVNREIFICLGRILMLTFVLMANSLSGGLVFQAFANLAVLLF